MENVNSQVNSGSPYNNTGSQYSNAGTPYNNTGSQFSNANTSGSTTAENMQNQAANLAAAAKSSANNAYNSVSNTQFAQDLANGPAATSVKNQAAATGNEFSELANSRKVPEYKAANDTPLTHYHNFFFNLLSWKHPRATAITYASTIIFIFASRYLPIARLALKGTWVTLGVVSLAEMAAKYIFSSSAAATVRPRKYYKIPKETLEATLDDVEQLINFFVIEIQRIVFAENIANTAIAFIATFLSYYLVKLLPAWGFALFATSATFLIPLVYTQNKEFIDTQYEHATQVVGQQTAQIRDLTAEHTSKGLETVKTYTGEYANLAGEYIGKSRQKIPSMTNGSSSTVGNTNNAGILNNTNTTNIPSTASTTSTTSPSIKKEDFPIAPRTVFPSSAEHTKPVLNSPGDNERINASIYGEPATAASY